jgi:hypothetical protein
MSVYGCTPHDWRLLHCSFGQSAAKAEAYLGGFEASYFLQRLDIDGDDVRVLRAYPSQWQVRPPAARPGSVALLRGAGIVALRSGPAVLSAGSLPTLPRVEWRALACSSAMKFLTHHRPAVRTDSLPSRRCTTCRRAAAPSCWPRKTPAPACATCGAVPACDLQANPPHHLQCWPCLRPDRPAAGRRYLMTGAGGSLARRNIFDRLFGEGRPLGGASYAEPQPGDFGYGGGWPRRRALQCPMALLTLAVALHSSCCTTAAMGAVAMCAAPGGGSISAAACPSCLQPLSAQWSVPTAGCRAPAGDADGASDSKEAASVPGQGSGVAAAESASIRYSPARDALRSRQTVREGSGGGVFAQPGPGDFAFDGDVPPVSSSIYLACC